MYLCKLDCIVVFNKKCVRRYVCMYVCTSLWMIVSMRECSYLSICTYAHKYFIVSSLYDFMYINMYVCVCNYVYKFAGKYVFTYEIKSVKTYVYRSKTKWYNYICACRDF